MRREHRLPLLVFLVVGLVGVTVFGVAHSGKQSASALARFTAPIQLVGPVTLDPANTLDVMPLLPKGTLQPIATLDAELERLGTFDPIIQAASSVTTEWALYTNSKITPPYLQVPSYVVILKDVPLKTFAHGGVPGLSLASPPNVEYDYYVIINGVTAQIIASFDEVDP